MNGNKHWKVVVKKKILKYSAQKVLRDIAYFSKYDSQMNHI